MILVDGCLSIGEVATDYSPRSSYTTTFTPRRCTHCDELRMPLAVSSRPIPKTRIHQDSRSTSLKRPRRRYALRRAKASPSSLETPSESSPFVDIILGAAGRDDELSFEVAMVSRDVQGIWKTGDEVLSYMVDHCVKPGSLEAPA
jgi:hypothetical protein